MKFKSRYGYKMMYYMLTHVEFGQRELAKYLEIKFGATVNNFVKWLEDLGYVAQSGSSARGGKKYQVSSPLGLISFYSKFRKIQLIDRFEMGLERNSVIEDLSKKGVIFCLTTALSQYSTYYTDPIVYAYLPDEKFHLLEDEFAKMPRGNIPVQLYQYDELDEITEMNGKKITSKVRTIIDLYCDNKAHLAEELAKELW